MPTQVLSELFKSKGLMVSDTGVLWRMAIILHSSMSIMLKSLIVVFTLWMESNSTSLKWVYHTICRNITKRNKKAINNILERVVQKSALPMSGPLGTKTD